MTAVRNVVMPSLAFVVSAMRSSLIVPPEDMIDRLGTVPWRPIVELFLVVDSC